MCSSLQFPEQHNHKHALSTDESQRRLERAAKRSTEITVRTEELRRRVQNLATTHHKMMEMLSLKFVGVDKLLSEIENKG